MVDFVRRKPGLFPGINIFGSRWRWTRALTWMSYRSEGFLVGLLDQLPPFAIFGKSGKLFS